MYTLDEILEELFSLVSGLEIEDKLTQEQIEFVDELWGDYLAQISTD
jgi:hypothetical protein